LWKIKRAANGVKKHLLAAVLMLVSAQNDALQWLKR